MKKTIRDVQDWQGKRVLVRVDFNVPQDKTGAITDDTRIQEALPTLRYLVSKGARVIVASHLGRPKGQVVESMRLAPVAQRLQELLAPTPVEAVSEVFSPAVQARVEALQPGQILLLENVRFEPGEEANDAALAQNLASLADVYVNDAFGTAHRAHASTEGVAHYVPVKVAGLLMEKEIAALGSALESPQHPYTAIIGGSKVSTKITVLQTLMAKVDNLVIGGGMMFTFLKAQGLEVGNSLVEPEFIDTARQLMQAAEAANTRLILPVDVVIADAFSADAQSQVVPVNAIPSGWMGLDIGPESSAEIRQVIANSKLVLWNGPLGVFEFPRFAAGTRQVADALAEGTEAGHCQSILGGGDTVAAIEQFGIAPSRYTHVSTGGGASLEFLEGKKLPGIEILEEKIPAVR